MDLDRRQAILSTVSLLYSLRPLLVYGAACQQKASRTLVFGITPWLKSELTKIWSRKIKDHFWQQACIDVKVKSAENYQRYFMMAAQRQFDVVDIPVHIAALLIRDFHFIALAQEKLASHAVIVVPKNTPLKQFDELRGKRIGMPDPLSMVSLLIEEISRTANSILPQYIYYHGHDRVLEAVKRGDVEAGAVLSAVLSDELLEDKALQILVRFELQVDGYALAHPELSLEERKAFTGALLSFRPPEQNLWQNWLPISNTEIEEMLEKQRPFTQLLKEHLRECCAQLMS